MRRKKIPVVAPPKRKVLKLTGLGVVALVIVGFAFSFTLIHKQYASITTQDVQSEKTNTEDVSSGPIPFPVSVDPKLKRISENPIVETYFDEHISKRSGTDGAHTSWLHKVAARLALSSWYQNLASLSTRTLVIQSGERREQVAQNFGKILGWDRAARADFMELISSSTPEVLDGKFFPGTYVVDRTASPEEVAPLVNERFTTEILSRYTDDVSEYVPLNDALTIASLLEREAYDFDDMRHISGVIWNRLFVDMNLQIDATLQYAKGSKVDQPWWPKVRPADKYITSPFNTYENEGLPPTPIANPSLDAILAALNPTKTDCMYYFHDRNGGFHCTPTYEEHVALLKQYYGRGK